MLQMEPRSEGMYKINTSHLFKVQLYAHHVPSKCLLLNPKLNFTHVYVLCS